MAALVAGEHRPRGIAEPNPATLEWSGDRLQDENDIRNPPMGYVLAVCREDNEGSLVTARFYYHLWHDTIIQHALPILVNIILPLVSV